MCTVSFIYFISSLFFFPPQDSFILFLFFWISFIIKFYPKLKFDFIRRLTYRRRRIRITGTIEKAEEINGMKTESENYNK